MIRARRPELVGLALTFVSLFVLGLLASCGGSSPKNRALEVSQASAGALVASAEAHFKRTTVSYPTYLANVAAGKYTPRDGSATEWGQALADLDAAQTILAEPPTTSTVTTTVTSTETVTTTVSGTTTTPPTTTTAPPTTTAPTTTTTAGRTVLWRADFESGKIPLSPPWTPYPQDTAYGGVASAFNSSATIIPNTEPGMPGTKLMRLTVRPDPQDLNPQHKGRAQINIGTPTHAVAGVAEGVTAWYEIPIYFPSGPLNSEKWDQWQVVWQFASGAAFNCPAVLVTKDTTGAGHLEFDTMAGGLGTTTGPKNRADLKLDLGKIQMDHAYIFDLKVLWSKNSATGRVQLDVNGKTLVPWQAAQTMATDQKDGATWLDPTNYRHLGSAVTSTVTFDVGPVLRYTIP